mmetsp:Transcript_91374/g.263085  ORF Transcript_91374/g.263085 Transcript_91374/m.263085 type:complete len:207 (-) Transcript_91374:984-1604(-)
MPGLGGVELLLHVREPDFQHALGLDREGEGLLGVRQLHDHVLQLLLHRQDARRLRVVPVLQELHVLQPVRHQQKLPSLDRVVLRRGLDETRELEVGGRGFVAAGEQLRTEAPDLRQMLGLGGRPAVLQMALRRRGRAELLVQQGDLLGQHELRGARARRAVLPRHLSLVVKLAEIADGLVASADLSADAAARRAPDLVGVVLVDAR